MKKIFALTAISAGLFASQSFAAPVFINIDDFNSGAQSLPDLTADGNPVTGSIGIRTVTNNLLSAVAPVGNTLDVTGVDPDGFLDITNGGSEDSEVTISWALASALLPSDATNIGFFFSVLQSDGNPTDLAFSLNGNLLSTFAIAGNTANQNVSFGLTPAQALLASAGGTLEVKINGAAGWDFSADAFGFAYEPAVLPPSNVPEPSTLGLLGLGLAALGYRKKKQG